MLLTGTSLATLFRAMSRPAVKIHDVAQRRREERRLLEENRESSIDIPLGAVMPQHPVRSIPEEAESAAGGKKKKKGKSPQLENLEKVFGIKQTEPDHDPVVIQESEVEQPAAYPVEKLFDANRQVPDFDVPQVEAQPENTAESAAPESHAPVAHEVVEAETIPPAQPAAPVTVADHAAQNPETAAEAERAVAESMRKKMEAEKRETQPLKGAQAVEESSYCFPPVTMLASSKKVDANLETEELQTNGKMLVETLKSFGVQTRVIAYSRGPTVTRYELQPSAGVKISKITGLSDDIALNLASAGVRIEAPIPNKAAVGIEVPNKETEIVTMREIIDTKLFREAKSKLTVALGRDISGHEVCFDIAKMPHMLIAGATGSGKSVCINAILMSILYKASPSEVKLLLVDPKVVELGVYNGIPHLLVPVVTDPRKAAGALGWAVTEMLNRYKLFADSSVRDIKGYNEMAAQQSMELMPEIVIIIDELADLMMAAPNEVEDAICRLAQMARAAGMHLIIATQRPSVDVITGVIKANIPSRIAFSVSSQVDSRTIIDSGGAEKLLGKGDMLFFPMGMPKPTRLQCCFVSDKEVEAVVDYIKRSGESAEYDDAILDEIDRQAEASANKKGKKSEDDVEGGDEVDPLLDKAIEVVIESGQASTSYLQRRLKVGYSRAARIIDQMEQKGVIGPFEGSKPRAVLMTRAQYLEMTLQPDHTSANDTAE